MLHANYVVVFLWLRFSGVNFDHSGLCLPEKGEVGTIILDGSTNWADFHVESLTE